MRTRSGAKRSSMAVPSAKNSEGLVRIGRAELARLLTRVGENVELASRSRVGLEDGSHSAACELG
jgi:hypothetical protein